MEMKAGEFVKLPERPKLVQIMGPGLITGSSDDDPSGIATYSQVGAQFGYGLAWTLILSYPLMAAIQEISARIGRTTGFGIAGNLRRHYPLWVSSGIVALLLVANLINLGADLGAMGAALKLLIGGPALVYVVLFGLLSALLQIFTRYDRYVSILKWLCLSLLSYVVCAFVVSVPWTKVALAVLWPPLSFKRDYLMAIVAVLGTTISPYLFFWQAEQEVEDEKERSGARPLIRAPEQARDEFSRIRIDTYLGMALSNIIAFFIVITTAATLNAHGVTNIQTSAQAAEALRAVAGPFCFAIFAAGIIGTGLLTGRVVPVACRAGAAAPPRQGILCDDRDGVGIRSGAQFHRDRTDQGALLERSGQWRGRGAGHGHDDATDHAPDRHGRVYAASDAADDRLASDGRHGDDRRRDGGKLACMNEKI